MNNLIEQNGKYYKEVDVVMLDTDSKSDIVKHLEKPHFVEFVHNQKVVVGKTKYFSCQHLYFLSSDEEIKEGDWCIHNGVIKQAIGDTIPFANKYGKKIIATTDESLGKLEECPVRGVGSQVKYTLPQPSPEFIQAYIEAYNSGQPITKVLVEYIFPETISVSRDLLLTGSDEEMEEINSQAILKLKDNQITIKKIEEKMYSESEVITLVLKMQHEYSKYKQECHYGPNMREITEWTDNWIKNNLK